MSGVPASFVGAWRRTRLVVGDKPRDDADVLWLQGTEWYADVRIPHADHGGPVEAFSGPASWEQPYFTWSHDLDWLGSYPDDRGHLEWDAADLVETGQFEVDGKPVPYSERWVRDPATSPRLVAVTVDRPVTATVVRVGTDAIVIATATEGDGFAVRRDQIEGSGMKSVFHREVAMEPLAPFPFARTSCVGDYVDYAGTLFEVVDVG
jgi:hypothetical protein